MTELEIQQAQLAEVRATISAVLQRGQSNQTDGAAVMRATLKDLRAMEKDLKSEIAQLSRGSQARIIRVVPK